MSKDQRIVRRKNSGKLDRAARRFRAPIPSTPPAPPEEFNAIATLSRLVACCERSEPMPETLAELVVRAHGIFERFGVRRCSQCGCTEHDACLDEEDQPCGWAASLDYRCTACL